jgi:pilus assembly protein FimV
MASDGNSEEVFDEEELAEGFDEEILGEEDLEEVQDIDDPEDDVDDVEEVEDVVDIIDIKAEGAVDVDDVEDVEDDDVVAAVVVVEDDDVVDDADIELALDEVLAETIRRTSTPEDDEEVPGEVDTLVDPAETILPKQDDEFRCSSCRLLKKMSQLSSREQMLCRDCV